MSSEIGVGLLMLGKFVLLVVCRNQMEKFYGQVGMYKKITVKI